MSSADEAPREILALEKALDSAELRYQDALTMEKTLSPKARAIFGAVVRARRAERNALQRQLAQLRGGAR